MKKLLLLALCLFAVHGLRAHDHIEVGIDPDVPGRLGLSGPGYQLALYVPKGEPFSFYLPQFPGGYYPAELTFSAEGDVLDFATGSLPQIELVSLTSGPEGAHFSFWEVGATTPTWTRPVGWAAADGDRPSIVVYEDGTGYGHIHGRAFTVDKPGLYQVVFRAVDNASARTASLPKNVTFEALLTPQLSIKIQNGDAKLAFTSRLNLTYDLQVSTNLQTWTNVEAHRFVDGTGGVIELSDPLAGRLRVFYRLVEYY